MPLPSHTGTPCETVDCQGHAERYVSCEGEGAYPYCRDCADLLMRHGETDNGPVDDPVVSERDRYRQALIDIAVAPDDFNDASLRAMAQEAIDRD